jgi:hypothetical protein
VRLGFYSLNVTNHGNFNAVYNNVTAPNFGQFADSWTAGMADDRFCGLSRYADRQVSL